MSRLSISITSRVEGAIREHAFEARPFECCGLLSGRDGVITEAHPLRNEAERRESKYFASPEDLFAAMRTIRNAGQRMLGIYHSHPRTLAYPSAADVQMAFYPEAYYFILSLEPRVELRAFKIAGLNVEDIAITIVGED